MRKSSQPARPYSSIGAKVVAGLRRRFERGERHSGKPLRGYDIEYLDETGAVVLRLPYPSVIPKKPTWIARPAPNGDAAAVRWAFQQAEQGASALSIHRELVKRGWRTRNGGPVSGSEIERMLRNPEYAGKLCFGLYLNGRQSRIGEREVPMKEGGWEPLVTWEMFRNVQRAMLRRGVQKMRADEPWQYLLSGAIECANCHRPVYGGRQGNRHHYACHNADCPRSVSIKREFLEPAVLRALSQAGHLSSGEVPAGRAERERLAMNLRALIRRIVIARVGKNPRNSKYAPITAAIELNDGRPSVHLGRREIYAAVGMFRLAEFVRRAGRPITLNDVMREFGWTRGMAIHYSDQARFARLIRADKRGQPPYRNRIILSPLCAPPTSAAERAPGTAPRAVAPVEIAELAEIGVTIDRTRSAITREGYGTVCLATRPTLWGILQRLFDADGAAVAPKALGATSSRELRALRVSLIRLREIIRPLGLSIPDRERRIFPIPENPM
jgi:hypothetical protein